MKESYKKLWIIPIVCLILLICSCDTTVEDNSLILDDWVENREKSIINNDIQGYLMGVDKQDIYLYKEESNLIKSLSIDFGDDFDIDYKIINADSNTIIAMIEQKYSGNGKKYRSEYRAEFIIVDDKAYYTGLDYPSKSDDDIIVNYPETMEEFADYVMETANIYLETLFVQREYKPEYKMSFKVYDDHSIFLQSVKLDLPDWVGGWHEYGESVKMYNPSNRTYGYQKMIFHECSHMYLSDITNDNGSYWVQEGFATLTEKGIIEFFDEPKFVEYKDLQTLYDESMLWKFDEFGQVNLEEIENVTMVKGYYALSSAYTMYFIENLGLDGFLETMETLTEYPLIDTTAAQKLLICTQITNEALSRSMGMTYNDMCKDIDAWIIEKIIQ